MNIAMFSTNDISGGAARACVRLNYGLLEDNRVDVDYFVKSKYENSSKTKALQLKDNQEEKILNLINENYILNNRTDLTNTLFSFSYNDVTLENIDAYDVINLHWVERFLSFNNLYELVQSNKPIIWTLHDMKPFTGGCHYSSTCRGYEDDCSSCLQLLQDEKKLPQKALETKHEIFKHANLTIVTPSVWLANEAKKSSLFKDNRIEVIPYGIDSQLFKPIAKDIAKKELGIDENMIVLSFGAISHVERRKGFQELTQAMELLKNKIKEKKVVALFFGTNNNENFPLPVINAGQINSDEKLSYIYSATDIFILPSLEDNLPNTILESLSCETPVIAFDTGGAKDIINDSNGKIVPKGDIQALSDEIYNLIVNKELREQKGMDGRKLILQKHQLHHQADSYIKLFDELKHQNFKYIKNDVDINSNFDSLIGYAFRNSLNNDISTMKFSEMYSNLYNQIIGLKNNKYIIYGNGTIGKTIQALLPEKIVGYVDIADENNHPSNLINMPYDKIIISVLGREKEILRYLTQELNIDRDKIITLDI